LINPDFSGLVLFGNDLVGPQKLAFTFICNK